jgi:GAF domain-containing protein
VERTEELSDALEQQTAVSEVLGLISRSPFDLPKITGHLLESAVRLCDARWGIVCRQDANGFELIGLYPANDELDRTIRKALNALHPHGFVAWVARERSVLSLTDIQRGLPSEDALAAVYRQLGIRAALGVPLVQREVSGAEDARSPATTSAGIMALFRTDQREFTPVQVELTRTFADQAAIAMANLRLLGEVRDRTREVQQLKIEIDEARRHAEVSEIVNGDFFQTLQERAAQMRARSHQKGSREGEWRQDEIDAYIKHLKDELQARRRN